MFTLTNSENERIRAESILRSFTEYSEAVDLFAPKNSLDEPDCDQVKTVELAANDNHDYGRSIMRVFKTVKLNRRRAVEESVQQPTNSRRQVSASGCSQ